MRRIFLIISSLLALSQIVLHGQQLERYESIDYKMGTTWKIIIYTTDEPTAEAAFEACWTRIDELNHIFSDYEAISEATTLSHTSGKDSWIDVSEDMWTVLTFSNNLSKLTDGAFDVTIGPLSKLWRRAIRQQEYPKQEYLAKAQSSVAYKLIDYDTAQERVKLLKSDMQLDFGGVAKGYTVDAVYKALEGLGIEHMLVDGGGDMRVSKAKPDGERWLVRLGERRDSLYLSDQSIATSGDRFKHLRFDGKRYAHIVHPQAGVGVENMNNITVLAADCMTADALASAISIVGQEEGKELIKHYNNSFFYITTSNGVIVLEAGAAIPEEN